LKTIFKIILLILTGIGLIYLINYLKFIGELNYFYLITIVIMGVIITGIIGKNK
jgi:hypothetical protein